MAVDQPGFGPGDGRERFLDVRDQLLNQGAPARAVRRRVGEDMMPHAAVGIEYHPDEVRAETVARTVREETRHVVIATEPGDEIERRPLLLQVPLRQDDCGAMRDRPVVERREERARDVHELDPVGLAQRSRWHELIDLERDRAAGRGVELDAHDGAVGVPLAVAELVGVGVEPDDRLRRVFAGLQRVERAGEADGLRVDAERRARLPVLGLDRKKRRGGEPVRPLPGLGSELRRRPEHHVHPRRNRSRADCGSIRHLERQRRPLGRGRAEEKEGR